MQPRTLAALAVAAGLVLGTGVLAIGATLMPSSAAPRPYVPVVTEVASDPATTIVTDVETVYDDAPVTSSATPDEATAPSPQSQPQSADASSAPGPAVKTAPASRSEASDEPSDDAHETDSSSSTSGSGPIDD